MAQTITVNGEQLDAEHVLAAIEEADAEEPVDCIKGGLGESGDVRVVGDGYEDYDVDVYDISSTTIEEVTVHEDAHYLQTQAEKALDTTVEPSDVSDTWMHAWTVSQDAYLPIEHANVSFGGGEFTMSRPEGVTMLSHDFPGDCFSGMGFATNGVERVAAEEVPFDDISDFYDA